MAEGQDGYVGLNVGGKIFKTSRTTLLADPDSFFSGLLDGAIPSARDDQGNYLIDQDGKVFRHVLNFMRYNELVLPEGFKEYGVLKRQADFFQLESLKSSIERPMQVDGAEAVGLVCPDGKVFHTTREILMREEGSYFTKMLSKESKVVRDLRGYYYLHNISSEFLQHALSFLTHGGILDPINVVELYNNDDRKAGFELGGFDILLSSLIPPRSKYVELYFYYNSNAPCFAYILQPDLMDTICAPDTVRLVRERLFRERVRIMEGVDAGVVNMEYINSKQPASVLDVITYFKADERAKFMYSSPITPNRLKLLFNYESN